MKMTTLFRSQRVPPNDMQVRALVGGRDLVEAAKSAPLSLVLGEYSYGRKVSQSTRWKGKYFVTAS